MKARKSPEEIQGMKNAHVRDAVAVCEFLAFMEREVRRTTMMEGEAKKEEIMVVVVVD